MATDKNDFDTYLKQNLIRDLIFRGVVWVSISLLAAYWSIHQLGINPLNYMERMGTSLGALLNSVGSFSILICIPALMFKDLELSIENPLWKGRMKGYKAGAIRRLAGDLSLWTLGATTTMLSTLILVSFQAATSGKDYVISATLSIGLLAIILVVGFFNFLVRRESTTCLTNHIKRPAYLITFYLLSSILLFSYFCYSLVVS